MSRSGPELSVEIVVAAEGADPQDIEDAVLRLNADLRELGVVSASRPRQPSPSGAKATDPVTIGALLLVVLPALLPKLVAYLQAWSLRNRQTKVKIRVPEGVEIEFSAEEPLSHAEVLDLVKELRSVAQGPPGADRLAQE